MSGLVLPPGVRDPRDLVIPQENVRLADGRWLKFRGESPIKDPNEVQCCAYKAGDGLSVIAALCDNPHGRLLHVSLAFPDRDPFWSEIRMVREVFFPSDLDVMMVLPREEDYVNFHEHCFHLWQIPVVWGMR